MKNLIARFSRTDSPPKSFLPDDAELRRQELQNRLEMRRIVSKSVLWMMIFTILLCFTLIVLDGFHVRGFHLADSTLKGMLGAVLSQATLYGMIVRGAWRA
jgi:hypothetical protein